MFGDLPKPALLRVLALKLIFLLPLFISIDLLGVWQLGPSNISIPVKRALIPYCPEVGLTIPWTNNIWNLHLISLCFSIFLPFSLVNLSAITLLNLRELFLFCPSILWPQSVTLILPIFPRRCLRPTSCTKPLLKTPTCTKLLCNFHSS